jgi:DNA-binding HxlR family transcriptional regulator
MAVTVPCRQCDGRGHRDLTQIERETLDALGDDWRSTADTQAKLAGISIQALANRLNSLRALGIVERRSLNGMHYEWRVKP